VRAAGNIKYIFDKKEDCEKVVLHFPRKVMTMAPGITISQAVVRVSGDLSDYAAQSDKLEQLLRAQRNKLPRPMTLGLMAIKRAPSTGLPAIEEIESKKKKTELIDEASSKKIKASDTKELTEKVVGRKLYYREIAFDLEDITDKNSWIAVIHADGNGLGNIVQEVSKHAKDIKSFSGALDKITKDSANAAYGTVKDLFKDKSIIPIRPIVLGGDDLTLICRADLAVEFTKVFLKTFEEESKNQLKALDIEENSKKVVANGLTACAGIAFVKSSYPFHYAVELAESLCKRAKEKAKKIDDKLAPSCLMFHKVQDSFMENFSEIAKRELTPQANLSFEYGPYYCGEHAKSFGNQCENTVETLLERTYLLNGKDKDGREISKEAKKKGNAIKSHIRQWISLLSDNVEAANQKMKRLRTINTDANKMINDKYESLNLSDIEDIPFYDILSLASILFIETEKKEEKK
jgi:hypothetical protein